MKFETKIEIVKRENQRHDIYLDVAYDINVFINALSDTKHMDEEDVFQLPEFYANDIEIARVDSSSTYRADLSVPGKKERLDRNTTNAKLKMLRWSGGLYVYTPEDRHDEQEYLQMVDDVMRSAIEKAMLRHLLSLQDRRK